MNDIKNLAEKSQQNQNEQNQLSRFDAAKQTVTKAVENFVQLGVPEAIAKRELGYVIAILQKSEELTKCSQTSLLQAVMNIARTGITLNPVLRLAYLIPRKGEAILDFSYQGYCKILTDSKSVRYVESHVVYEDEIFERNPVEGTIKHIPKDVATEEENKRRIVRGCYSVAVLYTGEKVFCWMPEWEIQKIKRVSPGSSSVYSPWKNWEDEMRKKTVIRRHYKMLPKSEINDKLIAALEVDLNANGIDFDEVPTKAQPKYEATVTQEQNKTTEANEIADAQVEELPVLTKLDSEKNISEAWSIVTANLASKVWTMEDVKNNFQVPDELMKDLKAIK